MRAAEAVAALTGGAFAASPGGHPGTLQHPVEFAGLLAETLVSSASPDAQGGPSPAAG